MPSRPLVPIWARIVGSVAFAVALGMLVWAVADAVRGTGVSEVVIDVFIAIVFGGIGATLFGLWPGGRGPVVPGAERSPARSDAERSPADQGDDSARR